MLRRVAPFFLLMMIAGCAGPSSQAVVDGARAPIGQVQLDPQAARRMINEYRASKGLNPLALDDRLARAARRHSLDLASLDRIDHKGSDGSDPWQRAREAGFAPRVAAENIGAGQRSLTEVMKGWHNSPGHDRNLLLPDATHMGIALEVNPHTKFGTFWTLILGAMY